MRILLVSYFFAPANTVGALRVTRLASFLMNAGHDVRVLAAAGSGWPATLGCDLPDAYVLRAAEIDINWLPRQLARLRNGFGAGIGPASRSRPTCAIPRTEAPPRPGGRLLHEASKLYTNALNWPDARAGWLPHAWGAARKLLRTWRPDLIYASSPPPSGLLLGKLLAQRCGAPWIAEFRDRWSDDPYYAKPAWRAALESRLERHILASARAIVTVSEPWAERYAQAYGKITLVVLNGFEPEDYAGGESSGALDAPSLEIVYTGGIYPGRRDPTPLFQALALRPELRPEVRIHFYGTNPEHVLTPAAQAGVAKLVTVHPRMPQADVAAVQQRADVLLLMQWNDPREQGNLPGKLFEYLGARRPILGLGLEDGVPARIIRERAAGLFSNDPAQIAAQIAAWLDAKRQRGQLPPLPAEAAAGFTRAEQFMRLQSFLAAISQTLNPKDAFDYLRVPQKRNHPPKLSNVSYPSKPKS